MTAGSCLMHLQQFNHGLYLFFPVVHVLGPSVVCVPKLVLLFLMGCKEVKYQLFFFYMQ